MKTAACVLMIVGILALAYGGIRHRRERTVPARSPIEASGAEQASAPLSPIAGAIALVGGILLWVTPKRRLG